MKDAIAYFQSKLDYLTDPADVKAALDAHAAIVVIDARNESAYQQEHIPQAIHLHHRKMNEESTKHLDRSLTYITYCDGIGCNASTKGALKMAQLGFKVKELIGGISWWKRDGYAVQGTQAEETEGVTCHCD
ncbi:MAG: rhodanese-like domain-containing protein [Flammeovirgaceae bacterium]